MFCYFFSRPIPPSHPVKIKRLENILFQLDKKKDIHTFLQQHVLFSQQFLGLTTDNSPQIVAQLQEMVRNPSMHQLHQEVQHHFPNCTNVQQQLTEAFHLLRTHYPRFTPPVVTTFITGMGTDLFVSKDLIVIGLDFFMGENAQFRPTHLPQYLLRGYQPPYLVPKIVLLLSQLFLHSDPNDQTLLADMLYYGKAYHFTRTILPHTPYHLIAGYTPQELQSIEEHQDRLWSHFMDYQLLYQTGPLVKTKYTSDRPFTPEIGPQCPGNIGRWLGGEIIQRYIKNTNIPLPQLMQTTDAPYLLQRSRYHPRKSFF